MRGFLFLSRHVVSMNEEERSAAGECRPKDCIVVDRHFHSRELRADPLRKLRKLKLTWSAEDSLTSFFGQLFGGAKS